MLFGLAASSKEHFTGNPGKLSKHICFALWSVSGMRQRQRPDDKPAVYYQGSTLKPSHEKVCFFAAFTLSFHSSDT